MSEPNPARVLAARVLERVRRGKRFSGDELERALRGTGLGREDRALTTTLVYGTLRHQGTIDWVLGKAANVKPDRVHPVTLDHVRVGAYQMLYLARIPAFAAVNDAVELVRRAGGRRAAGFTNAVLRALGRVLASAQLATGAAGATGGIVAGEAAGTVASGAAGASGGAGADGAVGVAGGTGAAGATRGAGAGGAAGMAGGSGATGSTEGAGASGAAGAAGRNVASGAAEAAGGACAGEAAGVAGGAGASGAARASAAPVAASGSARRDLPRGDGTCAVFGSDFLPDPADAVEHLAVTLSQPTWLVARWLARFGRERTESICRGGLAPPPVTLRVNRLKGSRDALLARLPGAEPGDDPWSIRLRTPGAVSELPGYAEGAFVVQDEASMRVAQLLEPRAGGAYVDLCAAPGGKSTHLAELMADRGRVLALDPQRQRLAKLAEACRRLGLRSVRWVCADGRKPPLAHAAWDGVLLDAPCSNTGVLARRVEARWRLRAGDVAALAEIQIELLCAAAALVRPGGRMVYSTCSVEPEENEERVALFLHAMGGNWTQGSAEMSWPAPGRSGGFSAVLERRP